MATLTDDEQVIEYDDYIEQQIDRTSFHVRTVELVCAVIQLVLIAMIILFAFVVVDHWLADLGFLGRLAGLLSVIGVSVFHFVNCVIPPLIRAVNPEYSALAVERSFPSLQNGVISYLFFRDQREQLKESIFSGMQAQVAHGLAEVPIDSAVDRSRIIKHGYVMIAAAAIWVGYVLLSPKDPLQTLQRIAIPWGDLQRPSQVEIRDVTPGNAEIFRGQTLDIEAKVFNLPSDQQPTIEFSTADGQLVRQQLAMQTDKTANHFRGALTTGEDGIQKDTVYRIIAGDGLSRTFSVKVVEAPLILVDRVEYDYPTYTGKVDEVVQGQGDIHAVEGTRVTIYGKANQVIRRAAIELLPHDGQVAKQANMTGTDRVARIRLPLRLDEQRKHSAYRGYRIHFFNEQDRRSVEAVDHTIEVIPDRDPIVKILTPEQRIVEIPVNGFQDIEVRALDPDYQLTQVQLAGRTRGRQVFKENLLLAETALQGHTGQFVASYRFVPGRFELQEGDVVEYLAVAKDNRHSALQGQLEPNQSYTARQFIRIVAAAENVEAIEDPEQPSNEDLTEDANADTPSSNQDASTDKTESTTTNESQDTGSSAQQQQTTPHEQSDQEQQPGAEQEETGLQQPADDGSGTEQQGSGTGSPGESRDDPSESNSGTGSGNSKTDSSDSSDNATEDSDKASGGGSSDNSSQEEGSVNDDGRGARNDEPLPSTGERDGEVVERIRDHMLENGDLPEDFESGSDSNSDSQSDDASDGTDGVTNPKSPNSSQNDPPSTSDSTEQRPETSQDTGTSDDSNQPSLDEADSNEQEGTGTQSNNDKDGAPSDKPGSPGDQGDRHTDAAQSADEPGPSPPDGAPRNDDSPSSQKQSDSGTTVDSDSEAHDAESTSSPKDGAHSQSDAGTESNESTDAESESTQTPVQNGAESGNENAEGSQDAASTDGTTDQNQDRSDSDRDGNRTENDPSGDSKSADPSSDAEDRQGPKSDNQNTSQVSKPGTRPSGNATGTGNDAGGQDVLQQDDMGDAANLEYAKKATDLVLEYLRDQEQQPDQKLLDKLGWTDDDVRQFLRRWDELKQKSNNASSPKADPLNETLRGMGLRPRQAKVRNASQNNDQQNKVRNAGRRLKVPANLLDAYRAYQRGLQSADE